MWGCFPLPPTPDDISRSLPHACGGVSKQFFQKSFIFLSSPRMWGCFQGDRGHQAGAGVFPTHVGVFPRLLHWKKRPMSLPHACGGVSRRADITNPHRMSSPRMWGCFLEKLLKRYITPVFPTHVGVFPTRATPNAHGGGLPHACGGVSCPISGCTWPRMSSPRMWGCFSDGAVASLNP